MLDVVVKRSQWIRGRGSANSALLTYRGERCCVGFACRAAGLTDEQILGVGTVAELATTVYPIPDALHKLVMPGRRSNSEEASSLYTVNDEPHYTDEDREKNISDIGARVGLRFTFED